MAVVLGVPAGLTTADTFPPPSGPITAGFRRHRAWIRSCHKPVVNHGKCLRNPCFRCFWDTRYRSFGDFDTRDLFRGEVLTKWSEIVIGLVSEIATFWAFLLLFGHFCSKTPVLSGSNSYRVRGWKSGKSDVFGSKVVFSWCHS